MMGGGREHTLFLKEKKGKEIINSGTKQATGSSLINSTTETKFR